MTLRTKSFLLIAIILTVTLTVTGLLNLHFLQQSLKNSILAGVEAVVQTTSESIAKFLEDSLNDARVAAMSLPVSALEKKDLATLEKHLRILAKIYPKFGNGLFILDTHGRIWVDYPPHPEVRGADVSFREYFHRTMAEGKGIIGIPYFSKRTGQPVLTFTALLRGSANQVLGVLGCSVQMLSAEALGGIGKIKIGKSGYVFVYNKSRLMIIHPDDARVLQKDVPAGANRLFDAAMEGFEGVGETVNSRGVPMLSAFRPIHGTDWIVAAQQPQSEAYAPLAAARRNLFFGILLAVIASLCLGTVAIRRITQPLARLRQGVILLEAAEQEGISKIKQELEGIKSSDEFGELARAFLDISQRLQDTLLSLRRASNDWERTFNTVPDLIAIIDNQNEIIKINQAMAGKLGVQVHAAVGVKCRELFHGPKEPTPGAIPQSEPDDNLVNIQDLLQKRLGPDFLITVSPLKSPEGEKLGSVYVARDISERRRAEEERAKLEARMLEVQKLESLGVLAGGIAHDFNNLLMAILGNADLALFSLPPASPARLSIEEIVRASQRAADLCHQMLAYSGKGQFVIDRYNLSEIVKEMAQILEVSVSKKATLRYSFAPDLPAVQADATQLRQVIMNLITNASESLGDASGVISISTSALECDRDCLSQSHLDDNLPEGRYVCLEVADTGGGMDEETQRRIFDPFFTTKFTGRGLGLAAVLGIVRGHQGAIKVDSQPGRGTSFKILLPAVAWEQPDQALSPSQSLLPSSGGTILLIDDDPAVRKVGGQMLQGLGFQAIIAASGREGLEVFREQAGEIDCVILDLTMPEMGGDEVFRELRRVRSDACVILSSGYNEEDVTRRFLGEGLAGFVQKPYTRSNLQKTLSRVLSPK